nr:hypothetical protein [uncultured Methanoregula sp.]
MFYTDTKSDALRFGDVVSGYILATPTIKQPILEHGNHEYNLDIELSQLCVVLSPSCSIGEKKLLVSPLRRVRKSYFENDYLNNDLTRLNRKMERRFSHSPTAIARMNEAQKKTELTSEIVWAFVEFFVYDQHEELPPYPVRRKGVTGDVRYYMIDFRDVTKVNCEAVIEAKNSPLDCIRLQLSDATRSELSDKIQNFYKRA